MKESNIQRDIQLKSSELGCRLFRNNVGRLKNEKGQWVHYGLCVGSSDLIGWTPVTITADMVGKTFAVFTAVEVKKNKSKATDKQDNFISQVKNSGGIALIARSREEFQEKIQSTNLSINTHSRL